MTKTAPKIPQLGDPHPTRQRGMLMSPPMVRATLRWKDPKTQTRRVARTPIKVYLPHEVCGDFPFSSCKAKAGVHVAYLNELGAVSVGAFDKERQSLLGIKPGEFEWVCPYGRPGDTLMIREAHRLEPVKIRGRLRGVKCLYEADAGCHAWTIDELPVADVTKLRAYRNWGSLRPGIHLFWSMVRLKTLVESVRVERLQSITEGDAAAEGLPKDIPDYHLGAARKKWFCDLWDSLNAKRGFSWSSNPWVWVVMFRRLHHDPRISKMLCA